MSKRGIRLAAAAVAIGVAGTAVGVGATQDSNDADVVAQVQTEPAPALGPGFITDTSRAITWSRTDSALYVVGPGTGDLARPGDLCFSVRRSDDNGEGCAPAAYVVKNGLYIVTDFPSGRRQVDGYLPGGFTSVAGGAAGAEVKGQFFTIEVPVGVKSLQADGPAGSRILPMPAPPLP